MKTTIAMLTASMATAILAHPFDTRSQQCNIAPSGTTSAKIQPLSTPTASTAQACQKLCTAHSSCKSFIFGLPTGAKAPTCKLYSVPAAQVPNQGNNLYVFDKACSSKAVPNTKPTQDKPRGEVKSKAARDLVCNSAPTGTSNSKIQPFATPSAKTAEKCQEACDAQASCKSFLFGLPADASKPVCKLYNVDPSEIPRRDDELYVFAKGCSAANVPTTAPTHDEPRGQAPSEKQADNKRDIKPEGKPPVDGQPPAGKKPKGKAPQNPPHKRDNKPEGKPEDKPRVGDKPPKNKAPVNPPNNKRGIKPEDKPRVGDKPKAPLPPKDKKAGNNGQKHN
ncbi:hypothetical protein H9Q72_012127 [Fusarium xylarioides]|uniref:Apple domain-containing protein n=1 Tax=Fusarium xylarioides TaxID=221167 RepID=A0A9P7L3H1_9HYPO|nr:hypothetical protein H9Q72_012127 [Fusarium xylarioides]